MKREYDTKDGQTIDMLNQLIDQRAERIGIMIRHSERFFAEDAREEPFMGLTENGKEYAFRFGAALRPDFAPEIYSSFMGRCIETAYLIEKGFTRQHGLPLPDYVSINRELGPVYIHDVDAAVSLLSKIGDRQFLRKWFDGNIDQKVIDNPEKTAAGLCEYMVDKLNSSGNSRLVVCVSHDWNLYPIKEFKLNLRLEDSEDIGYLDGLVFFKAGSRFYLTCHQCDPVQL